MNSRIQELAQQATQDIMGVPTLDQQKFAELIVQECVEIAKKIDKNPYLDEHDHARQIIKNIEQRFGVGE